MISTRTISTRLALAILTFAGIAGGVAQAAETTSDGTSQRAMKRFERLDKDKSGDLTFEEFSTAMKTRISNADTNHDGKVSATEIEAAFQQMQAERMVDRFIKRFDVNGDGAVTADEIESRQKRMFARLDKNSDGKLEMSEMPKQRQGGQRKGMGQGQGTGQGGTPGLDQGQDQDPGYDQN